jgi:trimeric autotransporter adhesin
MKNKLKRFAVSVLTLASLSSPMAIAFAQGTAFTYQGQLQLGGAPANGSYDLKFTLFPTNQFGLPLGLVRTNTAVPVSNGLFTTILDFGGGIFTGTNLWLDISVRTNGNGTFTELTPRQPVTPAPYAITAGNLAGVLENNLIQAGATMATIGGGSNNVIQTGASYSVIGAGHDNFIGSGSLSAAIGGGSYNLVTAGDATVAGGENNLASGSWAVVGGGYENTASNLFATVSGGAGNLSGGRSATVAGGEGSVASGDWSTITGGYNNVASGSEATVGGGSFNLASGADSFAAGFEARATNDGVFVWADSQSATFNSTATNQFLIRAAGGVGINMNNPNGASLYVQGNRSGGSFNNSVGFFENTSTATGLAGSGPALRVVCDGGSGPAGALSVSANGTGPIAEFGNALSFVASIANDGTIISKGVALTSDRNAKENFAPLDGNAVLAKVISIPLTEWNYKDDAADTRHIGPMAQDFHAAFQLNGTDDKHISVIDEGGVALAAIQGLNQKLESEAQAKDAEIADLKTRMEKLEQLVTGKSGSVK